MIITIDGPMASGKSTVAERVAHHFGYYYIASGLLYRAYSYFLVTCRNYSSEQLVSVTQETLDQILEHDQFMYCYNNLGARIVLNGCDITDALKSSDVDTWASLIATAPEMRAIIDDFQRKLAKQYNSVADGRDCGTTVFPDADYKFFLTASVSVRALRWQKSQLGRNKHFSLAESISIISQRDTRDATRLISPLIPADDAIIIDNSDLSIDQTVQKILEHISKL